MKLDRNALVQHLQKVTCAKQIDSAVFTESFKTAALTEDHQLIVLAPSMPATEPLPRDIGVADLDVVLKMLALIGNSGNAIEATIKESHFILTGEDGRDAGFPIAAKETIGTRVEEETVGKIRAALPKGEGFALSRTIVDYVQGAYQAYKAEEVELHVEQGAPGYISVGNPNTKTAKSPAIPELITDGEPYSLLFGRHLIDVFSTLTDFARTRIVLAGPGKMIVIREGAYEWVLSPRKKKEN